MKVAICCDDEVDDFEDQYELWCLLNDFLRNYPKSVSLVIYTLNYRVKDLAFKTAVKEK